MDGARRDCLFFVADKSMAAMIEGFFQRSGFHLSLGCEPFRFEPRHDLFVAAGQNDPGLYKKAAELTRGFQSSHERLVVMLDTAWEGSPGAREIERHMSSDLKRGGWAPDRFVVIAIDPELENWLFTKPLHLPTTIGWNRQEDMESWLVGVGLWQGGDAKPEDPKAAVERALREVRQPRSSAIYQKLASMVSLDGCEDPALGRLRRVLVGWFPPVQ